MITKVKTWSQREAKAWHVREWENWVWTWALRQEGLEETLAPCSKTAKTERAKKMEIPFVQGVPWRRWRVMGKNYFWGDSRWAQEANYSKRVQSSTEKISPGKRWIPQCQILKIQQEKELGQCCLDRAFAKKHWSRWCSKSGVPWFWDNQKK